MLLAENIIKCTTDEMLAGQCEFRYNELVGIKSTKDTTDDPNDPNLFVADVFLSATFFIWTLSFLGIVVSGLKMIIQWWTDPKKSADAMRWIRYSLIALIIVIFSYTIMRLIQYIVVTKV